MLLLYCLLVRCHKQSQRLLEHCHCHIPCFRPLTQLTLYTIRLGGLKVFTEQPRQYMLTERPVSVNRPASPTADHEPSALSMANWYPRPFESERGRSNSSSQPEHVAPVQTAQTSRRLRRLQRYRAYQASRDRRIQSTRDRDDQACRDRSPPSQTHPYSSSNNWSDDYPGYAPSYSDDRRRADKAPVYHYTDSTRQDAGYHHQSQDYRRHDYDNSRDIDTPSTAGYVGELQSLLLATRQENQNLQRRLSLVQTKYFAPTQSIRPILIPLGQRMIKDFHIRAPIPIVLHEENVVGQSVRLARDAQGRPVIAEIVTSGQTLGPDRVTITATCFMWCLLSSCFQVII